MLRWLALCLLGPFAMAAHGFQSIADWNDTLQIREAALAAGGDGPSGRFESGGLVVYLAPDGRYAMFAEFEDDDAGSAMVGTFAMDGAVLVLRQQGHAVDRSRLDELETASLDVMAAAFELANALRAGNPGEAELRLQDALQRAEAVLPPEAMEQLDAGIQMLEAVPEDMSEQRLLPVRHAGGMLLVDASTLPEVASRWRGGELTLRADMWRVPQSALPADAEGEGFYGEFVIADPLNAGLPAELTDLLIPGIIRARVVDVLTPAESLEWKRHRAEVRVRIDRGADARLFVGQMLNGTPPDEHVGATLVEVGETHAVATIEVERFSPADRPQLPGPGIVLANRVDHPIGCPLPVGVAVAAKVVANDITPDALQWDEDGFTFFNLEIDRGAAQGLAVGDRLDFEPEDGWCACEGRVQSVESQRATVLFRMLRFHPDQELQMPGLGDVLFTPAWRRAYGDFSEPGLPVPVHAD